MMPVRELFSDKVFIEPGLSNKRTLIYKNASKILGGPTDYLGPAVTSCPGSVKPCSDLSLVGLYRMHPTEQSSVFVCLQIPANRDCASLVKHRLI